MYELFEELGYDKLGPILEAISESKRLRHNAILDEDEVFSIACGYEDTFGEVDVNLFKGITEYEFSMYRDYLESMKCDERYREEVNALLKVFRYYERFVGEDHKQERGRGWRRKRSKSIANRRMKRLRRDELINVPIHKLEKNHRYTSCGNKTNVCKKLTGSVNIREYGTNHRLGDNWPHSDAVKVERCNQMVREIDEFECIEEYLLSS